MDSPLLTDRTYTGIMVLAKPRALLRKMPSDEDLAYPISIEQGQTYANPRVCRSYAYLKQNIHRAKKIYFYFFFYNILTKMFCAEHYKENALCGWNIIFNPTPTPRTESTGGERSEQAPDGLSVFKTI